MKKIRLPLKDRSYDILIGRNLLSSMARWVRPLGLGKKIFVVTNRRIRSRGFLRPLQASLKKAGYEVRVHLLAKGDERDKSKDSLFKLWEDMTKAGLERSSAVLALGGGVCGDVAAFAASTYMRGISVVQVPTTLLAQVDAAIGGKTAIDLPLAKNIVGTFHQPRLVVADLTSLGRMGVESDGSGLRELRNAFAEIIKYGIIRDLQLFRLLEKEVEPFFASAKKKPLGKKEYSFLEEVVFRSVRVKARVVEEDERETRGGRMILNYGHTFGHALEAASHYKLPHGEAVALGMVAAARLASRRGLIRAKDERRQSKLIRKVGLPTSLRAAWFEPGRVLRPMLFDKKKRKGKLRFVLPTGIGRVRVVEGIPLSQVKGALQDLAKN